MNWDDLKILVAVGRHGSFAGASRELGLDETTVARRLARIEQDLGESLMEAIDGRRQPTRRGKAVMAEAEMMARAAGRILAGGPSEDGPSGHVRIAATPTVASCFLATGSGDFLRRHPGISIELKLADANVDLARWEADLAIRLARPRRGSQIVRRLATFSHSFVEPVEGADGCAVCAYPESLMETPEMLALTARHDPERIRFRATALSALAQMLGKGQAAGILPDFMLPHTGSRDGIVVTPSDAKREVWLLMQPHLKNDPAVRTVADWIAECFRTAV